MDVKKHINVVGAIIVNERNQIFCALRSPSMSLPNLWEFPGGKIEKGEQPKETLHREILEELKIKIEIGQEVTSTYHEYDDFTIQLTTFYATILSGELTLMEHADFVWLSPEKLDQLNWAPADLPAVQQIQADFLEKGAHI